MVRRSLLCLAAVAAASGAARADIIGFGGNGSGFTLTQGGSNSGPTISNDVLTLTDRNVNEANAVFRSQTQAYAGGFNASFTYSDVGGGGADGFAFILQNDPRGASAVGGNGGSLAYGGGNPIVPSLAVEFNIYGGYSGSKSGIDDSGNIWYQSTGSVDLTNGTPVNVNIAYDALSTTVTETLAQGSNTFAQSRALDLASLLGNNGVYVGFTGSTGDTGSLQNITSFTYTAVPEPAAAGLLGTGAIFALRRRQKRPVSGRA